MNLYIFHLIETVYRQLDNRNWDRCEFHKQLVNTGILDALPLARCKYPIHFSYKEFFERYCGKRAGERKS